MQYKTIIYLVLLTLIIGNAQADDAAGPGPREEVLVSALRESVRSDIDASVTTLDRDTLQAIPLQHIQDVIASVPNMNLSGEGSRARYFQLRGIGELEQYEGAPNPSVGFVVDDIDLSGLGGVTGLFDVGRVEVLRGPQATRFGANALGGLVYVRSSADPEPAQRFRVTLGNDDTRAAGLALTGPLAASTTARLSAHQLHANGFYRNTALGAVDTNRRDERLLRAGLDWQGRGALKARLSLLWADFDNGYDAWSPDNNRITHSDNPGRDAQRTFGTSLRVTGSHVAGGEWVSITGLADTELLFSFDGEWGNPGYWAPYGYDYVYLDRRDRQTLSQDLRWLSGPGQSLFGGRVDWLIGAYFQRLEETGDILSTGRYDDSADAPFSYCAPCLDHSRLASAFESRNTAVYGKLDGDAGERLSWSFGLRLERWSADYDDRFRDEIYGDPEVPVENRFTPSENLWGGEFSLSWALDDERRIYALVSRGYKAGGFNPGFARVAAFGTALDRDNIAFGPESLVNFELGLEGQWMDGRLRGRVSLFRMQRADMQVRSSAQFTDNPNDFVFVTSNARGRARGLEASLSFALNADWSVNADLGLLSTAVEDYRLQREADIPGALNGRAFAHAPDWTAHLGLVYGTQDSDWSARLELQAMDGYFFDYSHDERADPRQLVHLALTRRFDEWAVTAWARNLFDEDYHTRGFSFGLAPPLFERQRWTRLGDPRHYGISLEYRH